MRKFLILLCISFPVLLFGQIDIINLTTTDSSVTIFYVGVDNLIKLKGNNDFSKYRIEAEGAAAMIDKTGEAEYIVRVRTKDTCKIILTKNGKQLLSRNYGTEFIPHPIVTVGGVRDTVISKNKLLLNPFLSVVFPGCYYALNTRVISFQATLISNGDSIATTAVGNSFSIDQIKLIKQLQKGDKIWFDRINGSCPSGRNQRLKSFGITIE